MQAVIAPMTQTTMLPRVEANAHQRISSLEKKPAKMGIPAMARQEMAKVA